jgi:hypothetical protein
MSSPVDIANMALGLCGARSVITAFTEPNPEAAQCSIWYDKDRLFILRAHRWNFARKQDTMTLLATAPGVGNQPQTNLPWPFMPWAYSYEYPADCVQFQLILPIYNGTNWQGYMAPNSQSPVRFKVSSTLNASNQTIRAIFTNQNPAIGAWTQDITNPDLFDSQFTEALAYRLAASLAIPLSGDKALANSLAQKSAMVIAEAESRDGNEGLTIHNPIPDFVRVRGTAADYGYGGYLGWGLGWGADGQGDW